MSSSGRRQHAGLSRRVSRLRSILSYCAKYRCSRCERSRSVDRLTIRIVELNHLVGTVSAIGALSAIPHERYSRGIPYRSIWLDFWLDAACTSSAQQIGIVRDVRLGISSLSSEEPEQERHDPKSNSSSTDSYTSNGTRTDRRALCSWTRRSRRRSRGRSDLDAYASRIGLAGHCTPCSGGCRDAVDLKTCRPIGSTIVLLRDASGVGR